MAGVETSCNPHQQKNSNSGRCFVDKAIFKNFKSDESEEPPQVRMARKVLSSVQPAYPFDMKAAQMEQKLQSEYSNIINYAKEKLNLGGVRLTNNSGAYKKLASRGLTLRIPPKPKVSTVRDQHTIDKANLLKAKDSMLKYIKDFNLKKRKEYLRIGFSQPKIREDIDLHSIEPNSADYPADQHAYKICDIWSMNFFEQYESQREDKKVSKKTQLENIKQSIIKDKQMRSINRQAPETLIRQPGCSSNIVNQAKAYTFMANMAAPDIEKSQLAHAPYTDRSTSNKYRASSVNRSTGDASTNRDTDKGATIVKSPTTTREGPKRLKNFRLSVLDTEHKAAAAVRSFVQRVDQSKRTLNQAKNEAADENLEIDLEEKTPEKGKRSMPRKNNNWQSLNSVNAGTLIGAQVDKNAKKLSINQITSSSNQIIVEDPKKSHVIDSIKNSILREVDSNGKPVVNLKQSKRLDTWILHNLYHGLIVISMPGKSESLSFVVGEGNNQTLVQKIFSQYKPWQTSGFYGRANLIWTQLTHKKAVCTSEAQNVSISTLLLINHFQASDTLNPDILTDQLLDLRLFKIADRNLVAEVFHNLIKHGEVSMLQRENISIANHVKDLKSISRKNLLYLTLKQYLEDHQEESDYSLSYEQGKKSLIPHTYLLWGDTFDQDLETMVKSKYNRDLDFVNPLIIKPGQNSNRGIGISMAFSLAEAIALCKVTIEKRKSFCSVIVQEYISRPLLFKDRKFDIRCYGLVIRFFDRISYYWYSQGYARTSSFTYDQSAKDNLMVHLTNEAVQVKGKYRIIRLQKFWYV